MKLPEGYEYVKPLGSGAFGDVILARQVSLGRLVAIKRIHSFVLTDFDAAQRFRREGVVLARLASPAIVRVYDFVVDNSGGMLVMEFVEGTTLADHIAGGSMPVQAALQVLGDVADALASAARVGVIHRDLKPENVFVLRDGHARLGDFGLARVVADPAVFRTADGSFAGTPAYFPPEVIDGLEPDERSDAYSFAVMAFETLTGTLPFDGDNMLALIAAHRNQPVPRAEQRVAGFPLQAADALERGLAKDPGRRMLPAELVTVLQAVSVDAWPATASRPRPRSNSSSTRLVSVPGVGASPSQPDRSLTRVITDRRVRRRKRVVASSVLILVLAAVAAALLIAKADRRATKLFVQSAVVSVNPSAGRCPGAKFVFFARISTNGAAGKLEVSWKLPGGRRVAARAIAVPRGQKIVSASVDLDLTGERSLSGAAHLTVVSGSGPRTVSGPRIRYSC